MLHREQSLHKLWLCTTFMIYVEYYGTPWLTRHPFLDHYIYQRGRNEPVCRMDSVLVRTLVASERTPNSSWFLKVWEMVMIDSHNWKVQGIICIRHFWIQVLKWCNQNSTLLSISELFSLACVLFSWRLSHNSVRIPPRIPSHLLIHSRRGAVFSQQFQ